MLRALPVVSGGTMLSQRLVSPTAAGTARLQPCVRAFQPCRRRSGVCVRAAMAGAADGGFSDPYQVQQLHSGRCSIVIAWPRTVPFFPLLDLPQSIIAGPLKVLYSCLACRQAGMHAGMHASPGDFSDMHALVQQQTKSWPSDREVSIWLQVLGVSPGASHEAVHQSYSRASHDAKGDQSRIDKIEAAYLQIVGPDDPYQVEQPPFGGCSIITAP